MRIADRIHPSRKLVAYMKFRARSEKNRWSLSNRFIADLFDAGFRRFFNVTVTDDGTILSDEENPAAFESYKNGRL